MRGASTRGALAALSLAALSLAACGPGASAAAPLALTPLDWNPRQVALGQPVALVERGADLIVFGQDSATLLSGGAAVAEDRGVPGWIGGGVVPAPHGDGTWVMGISRDGQLFRLRDESRFEPVSDRFGLEKQRVRALCGLGAKAAAFLLDGELAIADGARVTRFAVEARELACGGGALALAEASQIRLIPASGPPRAYPLARARVALTAEGRLLAATAEALFVQDRGGELRRVHVAGEPITALAAAPGGAWFVEGGELAHWTDGSVQRTRGVGLAADAQIVASASGDVWVVGGGSVTRYSGALVGDAATRWAAQIGPFFDRSCRSCHGPGASSGTELAGAAAWDRQRARITQRVVTERSMPPAGFPFSDEDREQIRRWAAAR
jgi:mono/diheme cytochrome c family protein